MELNFDMGIEASGGSQPYREEGASHHARRGKNAEAFLNLHFLHPEIVLTMKASFALRAYLRTKSSEEKRDEE